MLAKHKTDSKTQFIDASCLFKKETNNNVLTDEHITEILQLFANKADVAHLAKSVENQAIAENDYNLAVSSYETTKGKNQMTKINILQMIEQSQVEWKTIE